jgi:hypothetical protein
MRSLLLAPCVTFAQTRGGDDAQSQPGHSLPYANGYMQPT